MLQESAGEIPTERLDACPVCGAGGPGSLYRDVVDQLFDAPGEWQLDLCRTCQAAFLNPRPTPAAIGRVYTPAYAARKAPADVQRPNARRTIRQSIRSGFLANTYGYVSGVSWWQRILALPVHLVPAWRDRCSFAVMTLRRRRGGRLLDVGCGLGDFLIEMSGRDWDVEGVELDPAMLKVCWRRGLRVWPGTLEGQQYPDSSFDAITAKHVIEHVHEPVGFLRECHRLLKPGGTLVILTPNLQSLGHRIFARAWLGLEVPRHLVLFAPATLRRAAEQAGLHVVRLWTTARPSGFIWRVSSEIRRNGRSRYLTETTMTQRMVERASDTVVRLALPWNRMAGDELALVATKSPARTGD